MVAEWQLVLFTHLCVSFVLFVELIFTLFLGIEFGSPYCGTKKGSNGRRSVGEDGRDI